MKKERKKLTAKDIIENGEKKMYKTEKYIAAPEGKQYKVGDEVNIKIQNGGGCGGCIITKITDTGFRFRQGSSREKTVQYREILEIS